MLAPFALATLPETMPSVNAWVNAVALAVGGTGIAYILYFKLIADIGPAKAITVAYLVPLFGIIWHYCGYYFPLFGNILEFFR